MIEITLYTKEGCHLCDHVKVDLETLKAAHPHFNYRLHEIDITQNDDLFKRYRYTIPVLKIGSKTLTAPIDILQLKNALNL
ncbi:MAG: glutaredoxin family protein [Anaerolineales bacterium]|nr:glutaredoxin family protein [Anaerolineales bacterium]